MMNERHAHHELIPFLLQRIEHKRRDVIVGVSRDDINLNPSVGVSGSNCGAFTKWLFPAVKRSPHLSPCFERLGLAWLRGEVWRCPNGAAGGPLFAGLGLQLS